MNKREEIQKELEEIAPLLAKLERKENLSIPKGYFDDLTDNVLGEIQLKEEKIRPSFFEKIDTWLLRLFQPRLALALASAVGIVLAAYFLFSNQPFQQNQNIALMDLSKEEVNTYIYNNLEDFEVTDITEIIEEDISMDFLDDAIEEIDLIDALDDIEMEVLEELF